MENDDGVPLKVSLFLPGSQTPYSSKNLADGETFDLPTKDANGKTIARWKVTHTSESATQDEMYFEAIYATATPTPGAATPTRDPAHPGTGDSNNMMMWILAVLASGAIAIVTVTWMLRKKED